MNDKKRMPVWGWIGIGLGVFVLLVCAIGTIGAALSGDPEPTAPPTTAAPVTDEPTPPDDDPTTPEEDEPSGGTEGLKAPAKPAVKAPAPKPTMEDGLYHVGEDIPAGTYRLAEAVDNSDFCYWRKSRDAEGEKILDNDLASTGRLQVTLKAGQWFETSRCGTWVKR